jgi:NAD(P)-dependent dehydrogenase (short-subunit alcohol dehydrogenase family)
MEKQGHNSSFKLYGKVALITGSGTGIGQAIARRFAENGASIIIMGRRKEPLEQTSELLNHIIADIRSSARVRSFSGVDVSDEVGINEMFKKISEEFGKIDIVINNAGISGPVKTFTNASFKEFRDCVAIHLTGTFWTSVQSLQTMKYGSKIITISTFFTEENRYEQRPYRFRTPYTAAQGAKNRLAEALAWELSEKGIRSVATNPGPVHSDRIYKTVYPKAAAEFLRIGGFPGLSSVEIEYACTKMLPLLGEHNDIVSRGIKQVAAEITQSHKKNSSLETEDLLQILYGLLTKVQEIAEKIQNNTSNMIIDGEFLTQEEVADMVLNLCDDKISKLINGRIVPNDRVFYPVRPIARTSVDNESLPLEVEGKVVILVANVSEKKDLDRLHQIVAALGVRGLKQLIIFIQEQPNITQSKDFKFQLVNLSDEEILRSNFEKVRKKFGTIHAVVYLTGNYDYSLAIPSLSRRDWDSLVDKFINIPALITKQAVNAMCPPGAVQDPIKYKNSNGRIILVGPDAPVGKRISGLIRARSEIFRGALRPYVATVNQELLEVLGSSIRLYLIFPGNIQGMEPDIGRLSYSILHLISDRAANHSDAIFYVDEVRA